MAAPPGSVTLRAMASASMTAAPQAGQHLRDRAFAAADAAREPESRDWRVMALQARRRGRIDLRAKHHGGQAGARQEGAERHIAAFAQPA